jgi:hypothetical protein
MMSMWQSKGGWREDGLGFLRHETEGYYPNIYFWMLTLFLCYPLLGHNEYPLLNLIASSKQFVFDKEPCYSSFQ